MSKPRHILMVLLTTTATLAAGTGLAVGQAAKPAAPPASAAPPSNEELLRNLQCMEQRVRALESRLKAQVETGPPASAEVLQPLPTRVVRVPQNGTKSEPSAKPDEARQAAGAPAESGAMPAAGIAGESAKSDKLPGKSPGAGSAETDPCAPRPKTAATTPAATPPAPPPAPAPAATQQ